MIESTIQPINSFYENLEIKYEDSLDLIDSNCTENSCHHVGFCIGCNCCRFSNSNNLKCYFKSKVEDLKLVERVVDLKLHFKNPCFNCSSSFHVSYFEDGNLNLQKMFDDGKQCVACQKHFTMERSFYHNCNICSASFKNCKLLVRHHRREHDPKKPNQCTVCNLSLSTVSTLSRHILYAHKLPHKCSYCRTRYATKSTLKMHTLSHNKENPFSCKYCPKQYKKKQNLDLHLFEHTGGKNFKCDLCGKAFATRWRLNQHKPVHIETSFPCNYCPNQYKTKMGLHFHLFEHVGGKEFKCDVCEKYFATAWLLNQHKPFHMEKSFQCKYCPKQYRTKHHFDIHLLEHNGGDPFQCDLCNKTFPKRLQLIEHRSIHMDGLFQCKYCLKKYETKENLELHLCEHTGGTHFKCDLCEKTFVKRGQLNAHKYIHMERLFQCSYCPKKYRTKPPLDIHLFEHTGNKQFKCDLCDKTFAKKYILDLHMPVHMEKSFQCEYCPKQYKSKKYLDIHVFEHTGQKQFKCDLCDKTFAKQFLLNQHKSAHTGESFQCEFCTKQYKTKQCLDRHILFVHTGDKNFKCDMCDKSFATRYLLKRHKHIHMEISIQCKYCTKEYKSKQSLDRHMVIHAEPKKEIKEITS